MALPKIVYVATSALGVYYTQNFDDPGGDPTWTAVNDGLASLEISNLQLDPFDNAYRQYCVADGVLYVREDGGAWTVVLTALEVQAMSADYAVATHVWCDETIPGRIWLGVNDPATYVENRTHQWALCSHDYGATWPIVRQLPYRKFYNYERRGNIVARGDSVVMYAGRYAGGGRTALYSTDLGVTWAESGGGSSSVNGGVTIWRHDPTVFFFISTIAAYDIALYKVTGGVTTPLLEIGTGVSPGFLWQDDNDPNHMRCIGLGSIHYTYDAWATHGSSTYADNFEPLLFAPYTGSPNVIIVGGKNNYPAVMSFLGEENSHLWVSRAGLNWDTAPYTNAIPAPSGGVADDGVQAIPYTPSAGPTAPPGSTITPPDTGTPITLGGDAYVQGVTMQDYTGDDRGEPLPGDRGAWDVETTAHGQLHASDVKHEASKYHLPVWDAEVGDAPVWNGTLWESIDVATQAELDAHAADPAAHHDPVTIAAGSDPALTLNDQELALEDVLTPDEHMAIGDGDPHHAKATLGAGSDAALSLVGQEFTLTLPEPAGTTYRQFTYVPDGAGSFSFVVDANGMPVFASLDTE